MGYKTILVHVDQSGHADTRYRFAARLALAHQAHLVGGAMTGVSRFLPPETLEHTGAAVAEYVALMQAAARAALETFDATVAQTGAPSHEGRLVNDDIDGGMVLQARYADLVVVSQFDPASANMAQWSDLPEYLFMNAARPVLVLPHRSHAVELGPHALVAWDASLEATRAVTQALPLLKAAQKVSVVVLNPHGTGDHGTEPGADIALYLSRHGVKVDVVQRETSHEIGAALLTQAERLRADLMVMGGYGHTRFREMLLGGATRSVLTGMKVPVLFAH